MLKKLTVNLSNDTNIVIVFSLIFITLIVALIYLLVNQFITDFHGITYVQPKLLIFIIPAIILFAFAVTFSEESPHLSLITKAYTTYYFIYLSIGFLATSVQYTPFPTIDPLLIKVDKAFDFHTVALMRFAYHHLDFARVLAIAYDSLAYQLLILPCLLIFLPKQEKQVFELFKLMLITACIGMSIYYFFPTVGPAHFFHSQYFTAREENTFLKFYQIHHYEKVSSMVGGMIAFPSFHALWAILLTYAYRKVSIIFYPLIILNSLLILATVFLGWHYLTDILGSVILFILVLAAYKILSKRLFSQFQRYR